MAGGERLESCLRDDVEVMRMRLLLLPGLGADMRLFLPQLKAFSDSVTPGWIDPEAGEGLRAYSERYLPYLVEQGHVPRAVGDVAGSMEDVGAKGEAEDGWALVGFSFGAQIALEMARLVARRSASAAGAGGLRGVVLVAAHRTSEGITPEFRKQVARGAKVPDWLVRPVLKYYFSPRFAKANDLSGEWKKRLKEMGGDADPGFLKWASQATSRWSFSEADAGEITGSGVPIHQIHGRRDDAIPLEEAHADRVIEGPHLITWTNAEEVNEYIAEKLGLRL